jgi:hypothetical protein
MWGGWMEVLVCTGAIFSGNRRNCFGAGGGKGLKSTFQNVDFWGNIFRISMQPTNSNLGSVNILNVSPKVNIFYVDFAGQLSKIALK